MDYFEYLTFAQLRANYNMNLGIPACSLRSIQQPTSQYMNHNNKSPLWFRILKFPFQKLVGGSRNLACSLVDWLAPTEIAQDDTVHGGVAPNDSWIVVLIDILCWIILRGIRCIAVLWVCATAVGLTLSVYSLVYYLFGSSYSGSTFGQMLLGITFLMTLFCPFFLSFFNESERLIPYK